MANEPQFIERDADKIVAEMVAEYESLTGKTLHPAQPERLLIQTFAYREALVRQGIQDAALQNLLAFSSNPALDFLGELVGVTRLPASVSTCTIRFVLIGGHTGVTIPAGTRVASTDGKVIFETIADKVVAAGVTPADVEAECQTPGVIGNGYVAGEIKNILDPQSYLVSAANLATTAGGAEQETDDELRERIRLAPAAFSTAGSKDAYKYWTKTAHASIIDVEVTTPTPGTVNVYPLVEGGIATPAPVIAAVEAVLSDEKVRPLTDTVQVLSPTAVDYDITADVEVFDEYDATEKEAEITEVLEAFGQGKLIRLGIDVTEAQIIGEVMKNVEGIYTFVLGGGWADVVVAANEFAKLGTITLNVTTTTND